MGVCGHRRPGAPALGLGPVRTGPGGRSRKDAGSAKSSGVGRFSLASGDVRTHTTLMTTTNAGMVEMLVGLGGREWTKGGHHRVYLTESMTCQAIGLVVTRYESGNVSSARLAGETISNGTARELLREIDGLYYDGTAAKFIGGRAGTVGRAMRERLATTNAA